MPYGWITRPSLNCAGFSSSLLNSELASKRRGRSDVLGMPNKVIGAKLTITEKTIKTHANRIFRKLEVTNRLQAVLVLQEYERVCRLRDGKGRGRA
jgi:DNA-binding CsgD family transcriptional regulator